MIKEFNNDNYNNNDNNIDDDNTTIYPGDWFLWDAVEQTSTECSRLYLLRHLISF